MNPDYRTFPRVVPVGREAEVCLAPALAPGILGPDRPCGVRFFSKVNRSEDLRFESHSDPAGALRLRLPFTSAGEYTLEVTLPAEEKPRVSERFFAVAPALAGLRPCKGDVHVHTVGSDGRHTLPTVLLRARELGMDFLAITDHDNHAPSRQAAVEVARLGLGLTVLPGEEVTIRESGGHILALNASGGVGELCRGPANDAERAALIRDGLGAQALIPPLTPETYSHGAWTIRKIRELGGCALIAHPCWEGSIGKFYPPRAMVRQLMRDGLCDGIELLGGSPSTEGNLLAAAEWTEAAERGRRWPVVGGSDAHAEADLGRYWTVAFVAGPPGAEEIVRAIRAGQCVACGRMSGPDVAIFGAFELVEYAYWLEREFFPLHDRICRAEAGLCAPDTHRPPPGGGEPGPGAVCRALAALQARFWL